MTTIEYPSSEEFSKRMEAELEKRFQESGMGFLLALPEETAIMEWCKIVTNNYEHKRIL